MASNPIKTSTSSEVKPEPPVQPATVAESTPVMTDDKWKEKDRITRKSIERQTSLNAAVELAKKVDGVVTSEKIIATAKVFEAYLEGKEVQKASRIINLVEAAKKLNAEIEEEVN